MSDSTIERAYKVGDDIYKLIKEGLNVDFGIRLDEDAESEWNEFWDTFVLSRIEDEEDDE